VRPSVSATCSQAARTVPSRGGDGDLPLGSDDPTILLWAERAGRILLSLDEDTMPGFFQQHLQAGHHSPGLFLLNASAGYAALLHFLEIAAYAGNPADFQDQIWYIP
jgi:hypothetical protein